MISGTGLCKAYGPLVALSGVDISCGPGEICGVLGNNGAGKSTLFKILLGLGTPDSGKVSILSNRKKPLGGIIEKPALYGYLSAYENLKVFSRVQGAPINREALQKSLLAVGLPLDRKDPVRNFSMGMKQRLGIAVALLNDPQGLILDEPFSGLDPLGIASLKKLILKLAKDDGLAILISSHIIGQLSETCDTLFVLKAGKLVGSGPTHSLLARHTDSYVFCGPNLAASTILTKYKTELRGNCASVRLSPEEVPGVLRDLIDEGTTLASFAPELNMKSLFENE